MNSHRSCNVLIIRENFRGKTEEADIMWVLPITKTAWLKRTHLPLPISLGLSLSHTPCRILQIMLFNTETSISVEMHGNYNNVLKDQSERAVWPLAGSMADKRWLLTLREKGWSIMRAAWGQDGKGVIKCKKKSETSQSFLMSNCKEKAETRARVWS